MNSIKNNKLLSLLTLLLLVMNVVTLTMVWKNNKQHNNPGLPPIQGPVFEFVTRELNLTEHQQAKYKLLREEHQAQQRPLLDSIRKAKETFFELLKDTAVSEATVAAYNNKGLALQGQLELVNFKHFQKLRAICNNEQQKKFDGIIQTVLRRLAPRPPGPPPGEPEREGPPGR